MCCFLCDKGLCLQVSHLCFFIVLQHISAGTLLTAGRRLHSSYSNYFPLYCLLPSLMTLSFSVWTKLSNLPLFPPSLITISKSCEAKLSSMLPLCSLFPFLCWYTLKAHVSSVPAPGLKVCNSVDNKDECVQTHGTEGKGNLSLAQFVEKAYGGAKKCRKHQ